jgi:hypothetical protein
VWLPPAPPPVSSEVSAGDRVVVGLRQRLSLALAAHGLPRKDGLAHAELVEHHSPRSIIPDLRPLAG